MFKRQIQYKLNPVSALFVREGEDPPAPKGPEITPEIQALIDAQVAQNVAGLKNKNQELLGNERKLKDELKRFEGIDVDRVKSVFEQLDNDEDSKLWASGKKNVVIEKHTERMRQSHTAELDALRKQVEEATKRGDVFRGAVLDNHIRAAAGDLHKGAVEDALLHARQLFTLDDKGNAVKLNGDGTPELGKDGKTAYSPQEWIEQMREQKPHWFPAQTSGSGSTGAEKSSGGGKAMKRAVFGNMNPVEQATFVRSGGNVID